MANLWCATTENFFITELFAVLTNQFLVIKHYTFNYLNGLTCLSKLGVWLYRQKHLLKILSFTQS